MSQCCNSQWNGGTGNEPQQEANEHDLAGHGRVYIL